MQRVEEGKELTIRKTYLGDSVYCEWDGFLFKLYTDNGLGPTNTIFLEDTVYRALIAFGDRMDVKR